MRGTQISNLFGQIWPLDATKIKNFSQILKLQYLDFLDSVSDEFFFQLGYFYDRNSDLQSFSENFAQKYTENFENVTALFFSSPKKKSAKIKNICPQCLPRKVF